MDGQLFGPTPVHYLAETAIAPITRPMVREISFPSGEAGMDLPWERRSRILSDRANRLLLWAIRTTAIHVYGSMMRGV